MQEEAKPGPRQQAIDDLNRCISRVMGGYNAMDRHAARAKATDAHLNALTGLFQRQVDNAGKAAEIIATLKEQNAEAMED